MAAELERLEALSEKLIQPDWWVSLQTDHLAGMANVFILTGNVFDYVEHVHA